MADSVLIAIPYYRDFEGPCTISIARTVSDLGAHGVETACIGLRYASIAEQRDALVDSFLATHHTHILFVDSDMMFPKSLARTLKDFDLPFVGAIYAKREISLPKIIEAARAGKPNPEAHGYTYSYWPLTGPMTIASNGLCEVNGVGFGFVLLRRDCLEMMRPHAPVYDSGILKKEARGFFQPTKDGAKSLSEDFSFCHRWRQVGGKVLAYTNADIQHIGTFNYGVPFSVAVKAGAL